MRERQKGEEMYKLQGNYIERLTAWLVLPNHYTRGKILLFPLSVPLSFTPSLLSPSL
jgi:hypothetical protein